MPNHNFRNRVGEKYGHLLVIEQAPNIITPNGRSHVAWKCLCDCGNEKIVRGDCLQNGSTKSCGCQMHGQRVIDETGKFADIEIVINYLEQFCQSDFELVLPDGSYMYSIKDYYNALEFALISEGVFSSNKIFLMTIFI